MALIVCFSFAWSIKTPYFKVIADEFDSTEEKTYNTATIDDEFTPGDVIVVINLENSAPNKPWFEITEIKDLSYLDNKGALEWIDEDRFGKNRWQ